MTCHHQHERRKQGRENDVNAANNVVVSYFPFPSLIPLDFGGKKRKKNCEIEDWVLSTKNS